MKGTLMLTVALVALILPVHARLPYIVGGEDAEPGKWPWQASLQLFGSHACGAAIISDRWLVTAAHCVEFPIRAFSVVLGLHDRTSSEQGNPKSYNLAKIIKHPEWTKDGSQGFPNDIAVIQLKKTAALDGVYAQSVHMADADADFEGNSDCWITGWGKTGFTEAPANILQEANVDVYDKATCQNSYGDVVTDNHICVGKKGKSGACSGDSGGPLVCGGDGDYTLAGVTSFGRVTCSTSYPSVYTRISAYRSWIRANSGV